MHFYRLLFATLSLPVAARTILQVLEDDPDLQTFSRAVQADSAFAQMLQATSPITVLAPVNAALDEVDIDLRESRAFLSYHILQGAFRSTDIPIVEHTIDRGIIMRTFLRDARSPALPRQVAISGYQSLTAFALGSREHVIIASGGPFLANVSETDIAAGSSVIHKLEKAVTLPTTGYQTARHIGLIAFADIVLMAGLDEAISDLEDITLLIPINEALEAIAPFIWGASADTLRELVYRHIILNATLWTNSMNNGTIFRTAHGNNVELIIAASGNAWIDHTRVLRGSNIPIYNGVAHVVSRYDPSFVRPVATLTYDPDVSVLMPLPLEHT